MEVATSQANTSVLFILLVAGSDVTTVLVVLWKILLINVVYKKETLFSPFDYPHHDQMVSACHQRRHNRLDSYHFPYKEEAKKQTKICLLFSHFKL